MLARLVVELTNRLSASSNLPAWILDVTDDHLKDRGRDWNIVTGELDGGNGPGSILLLAMLLPEQFGVPGARPLRILGDPPDQGIIEISHLPPRSGKGADNRRTNLLEGLLHPSHGLSPAADQGLRGFLLHTWRVVSRAEKLVNPKDNGLRQRVFEMCRPVFEVPDEVLIALCEGKAVSWMHST